MQLQVACDTDMIFTDVYCGWPGAAHDARVLRNNSLFHGAGTRTDDIFQEQTYIIGEFKDNLTAQQKRFTNRLSSKRMVTERGIGLLKGRFRKLKVMVDIDRIRFLPKLVDQCMFLGNCPPTPPQNLQLKLTSRFGQNVLSSQTPIQLHNR